MLYYKEEDILSWSYNRQTGSKFPVAREGAEPISEKEYNKLKKKRGIEPHKKEQIEKNLSQKKEVEDQHKELSNNQKLAKLYGIDLKEKASIDQEVLATQIDALKSVADEFPKAQQLLKKYYGHDLQVIVEPHGETENDTASGYTRPTDAVIRLNAAVPPFDKSLKEGVEASLRFGKKGKWGNSVLSTDDIRHSVVHEYGHILQYILAKKWGAGNVEMQGDILQKLGIAQLPKTLSTYANKNTSEFISEAIAQTFILKDKASKESKLIYNIFKKELG